MNPQPEHTEADLWSQLRESMGRLAAVGRRDSDPAALAQRLEARARLLRGRMLTEHAAEAPLMVLAFHKGRQRYGILVEEVIEVLALDQFCPVPKTPAFLPGVIPWRGNILALLDLGKLLGIPESGIADIHVCLIVEAAGRKLAVVALDVEDILIVPKGEVKPPPELPLDVPPEWILGVHGNDRTIVRMDKILHDSKMLDWRQ
jgi:purine-binding chemotaxis protein CheW